MSHLFNHQPLLAILVEVLDYSDLVNLSQIERRFVSALKIRQQKLMVIQSWAERTFEIGQLTNLQTLVINNNRIESIPPTIGQLTNLRELYLSENQITEIPPAIGQLTNLKKLCLCGNQISEIPPEIGHLINLQVLNLLWNQIKKIPPAIGQLTNLETLTLNGNQISEIPPEIGQLTNLRYLDLDYNQITEIPPDLFGEVRIAKPAGQDLFFKVAPEGSNSAPTWGSGKEIGKLNKLVELNLEWNQISEIPPNIKALKVKIYI